MTAIKKWWREVTKAYRAGVRAGEKRAKAYAKKN